MNKENTLKKALQQLKILCFLIIMAGFVFAGADEVKAVEGSGTDKKKESDCYLYSVTISVNGETHELKGDIDPIVVPKDTNWKDYLSGIEIVDYKVLTSDECTHQHHDLTSDLDGSYYNVIEYSNNTSTNNIGDIEASWTDGYYGLYFESENTSVTIAVMFTKSYNVTLEFDGGSLEEGEVEIKTYNSCDDTYLPILTKEGHIFKGWIDSTDNTNTPVNYIEFLSTGDKTYTAKWEEGERTEISGVQVNIQGYIIYSGTEKYPNFSLLSNDGYNVSDKYDYKVIYKNNVNAADADSENPPTLMIIGIGKNTGTITQTFTIAKSELIMQNPPVASIIEGKALNTSIITDGVMLNKIDSEYPYYEVVDGTWSWKNPNQVITESGEYAAVFTPTDTSNYESYECDISVTVYEEVKYEIIEGANSNWTLSTDGSLTIIGNGERSKFQELKVDGKVVDTKHYTVKSDSTIITLKADYLNTLSEGEHTLEMVWTDGTASTKFTASPKTESDEIPALGDNVMLFTLLLAGGLGLFVFGFKRRNFVK